MAYDLKPFRVPRLAGAPLRLVASLAGTGPLSGLLQREMEQNLGLERLRKTPSEAPPTFRPPIPRTNGSEPPRPLETDPLLEPFEAPGFRFESAGDFVRAYREGQLSPLDVAERVLEAIQQTEAHDPPLRVFIAHDPGDVRRQAEASAERWRKKQPKGPLDGVPVAIKDEVDLVPYPTTAGTRFLGRHPARQDATSARRLREAGAILLGKANMSELGMAVTGLNPHHGTPRNPYDPARHTGGSSSGSAAAVASGLCPLALAADGGGSIRQPAAFCGLFGLKPTFGRISEHGAVPLCWSVAHLGPIAATARDLALGYALMAGPDEADPQSMGQPPPDLEGFFDDDLSKITLGVFPAWVDDADPSVAKVFRQLLAELEGRGAKVKEIEIPGLDLLRVAHLVTIGVEMAASQVANGCRDADYGFDVRLNLALARGLSSVDYVHAQRHRTEICARFQALLHEVDLIVSPTTGCTAPRIPKDALTSGESNLGLLGRIMLYAPAANFTGLPAVTVPAGYDDEGIPVGFQAMGRAFSEALLLRLARIAEGLVERRAPKVHHRLISV